MKKLLTLLCVLSLLACCLPSALAAAPTIAVGDKSLTIEYENPNAAGDFTYMLLDEMGRIAQVEINAGNAWTLDWTQEGKFKVRAYYKDANGKTLSEESDFEKVSFRPTPAPLNLDEFLSDTKGSLPSGFTQPVEYNEPTPWPTRAPAANTVSSAEALMYTLQPAQPVVTLAPAPAPVPAVTQPPAYPGTRPCFDHMNIRIRISDNDNHAATKGRSGPGIDSAQVATLNIGEVYDVLDCRIVEQGNVHWFKVCKDGEYCWVASGRCERYH